MKRMRIALCLEYPIGQQGGTEVLVTELIRGLSARHEILLVSPDDTASLARSPVAGLVAEHIAWPEGKFSRARARELAGKISAARPDLVHFHFGGNYGWGNRLPFQCPVYYLRHSGISCLSTVHLVVSLTQGYSDPRWPLWYKLVRLPLAWWGKMQQLRQVRCEIAVSQTARQKLRRWYWPFRKRFLQIYHSRLPATLPVTTPIPRQPIILNVGHIAERKGQAVLAAAFAQVAASHPEWTLQLVGPHGGDVAWQRLQKIVKTHKLARRVLLPGPLTNVSQLMSGAAIFVQPSFHEGLPLSLQEALFYGCACVATRIEGNTELVEDEHNGLLVPAGDVGRMAEALTRLMRNAPLRERLAVNGHASILDKRMTAPQMIETHEKLYESLLRATS